jgi:hypothetical protein
MNNKRNKLENKNECEKRANNILDEFNLMIEKTRLDPILETFKSNEKLQEFYMQRVFEIITVNYFLFRNSLQMKKRII